MQALVSALYWLSLSAWFGAVLLSAIAPPIIVRVLKDADPTLPKVLSVNLDQQHSTLLASLVVGDLLVTLFRLEAVCAAVLLPALVGQWLFVDRSTGSAIAVPLMVTGLYVAAVACLLYGWRVVWPRVLEHRTKYIDQADNIDVANAELDQFDRYSMELFSVVRNLLFVLIGVILFSANFLPHVQSLTSN